ncbi:MAG TPA: glycoside hydrolase family 25 protein [Hanamia sp.]
MAQLKVIVNKLNRRTGPVTDMNDKSNIIGTVPMGFIFESKGQIMNGLGTWYSDSDGYYYWGNGLIVINASVLSMFNIKHLPLNLPPLCQIGIDVSHYNDIPNWPAVKNTGVRFTYIKISEGVGSPDTAAGGHATAAKQSAIKIGYYHFCHPDTRSGGTVINDANAEADDAMSRLAIIPKPDLPLVLDLEDSPPWDTPLSPNDYLEWINTFISRIQSTSGLDVMLYSRKSYLDVKLPRDHDLGKYKLWISNYSVTDCNKVICPVGWADWAMWQYCEDGVVAGNPSLDINILKDQSLF